MSEWTAVKDVSEVPRECNLLLSDGECIVAGSLSLETPQFGPKWYWINVLGVGGYDMEVDFRAENIRLYMLIPPLPDQSNEVQS